MRLPKFVDGKIFTIFSKKFGPCPEEPKPTKSGEDLTRPIVQMFLAEERQRWRTLLSTKVKLSRAATVADLKADMLSWLADI